MSIIEYYPPVIRRIREIKQIAKAEDIEFSKLYEKAKEVEENMYLSTASEAGVIDFENMLGITPKTGQSIEERKAYILYMMNRQKMSLTELEKMLSAYSKGIRIRPDYQKEELEILLPETERNPELIYGILDNLLPLQVYIRFAMAMDIILNFLKKPDNLTFKTAILIPEKQEKPKMELETDIQTKATTKATVTTCKDMWQLDGTVMLDGSRTLDAQKKEEEL